MRRYYSKKCRRIMTMLGILVLCVSILLMYVHHKVKGYTEVICTSSCQKFGQTVINEAVEDCMSTCNFSELMCVNYGSDGSILSISADNVHINKITSQLTDYISQRLTDDSGSSVKVPAGTFSGISFLGGVGPGITIEIFQVSSPDVELVSRVDECGINQTVYRLYAIVTLELTAVMPTESVDVTVEREVLLDERIIIGEVPSTVISGFENN